jgi:MbtH protein
MIYLVVVNQQDQHALWPAHKELPPGWQATGVQGDESACLDHIAQVWTDILPRDVRGPGRAES